MPTNPESYDKTERVESEYQDLWADAMRADVPWEIVPTIIQVSQKWV